MRKNKEPRYATKEEVAEATRILGELRESGKWISVPIEEAQGLSISEYQKKLDKQVLRSAVKLGILPEGATTKDTTISVRQEMLNRGVNMGGGRGER